MGMELISGVNSQNLVDGALEVRDINTQNAAAIHN